LLAGTSQTPGGRRNWVSLSSIPGVQMKGYIGIDENSLDTTSPGRFTNPKKAEKNIDIIMGQLGGQYIGYDKYYGTHYFAFDVKPTTTGKELEAAIKTKLNQLYGGFSSSSGLYAVWNGQA
jgi:hypothetical protein